MSVLRIYEFHIIQSLEVLPYTINSTIGNKLEIIKMNFWRRSLLYFVTFGHIQI